MIENPVRKLLSLLLASLLSIACSVPTGGSPPALSPTVTVATAKLPASSSGIVAVGRVVSRSGASVNLSPRISGIVAEIYVGEGEEVVEGQMIASLEDEAERRQVELRQSFLEGARVDLEQKVLLARNTQILAETGLGDLMGHETALLERKAAGIRVVQAEHELALARIAFEHTRVYTSLAGTVTEIRVGTGEAVAAGFSIASFIRVVDLTQVAVIAMVDEFDLPRIFPGLRASLLLDQHDGLVIDGTVERVGLEASVVDGVTFFPVIISFESKLLRPGNTTIVRFLEGGSND